jgi:hypothetical protein
VDSPADEDVHARLARHGLLVSDDFPDSEVDDALASTMLSVIESMLASAPANEKPPAEPEGDAAVAPSASKPSTHP